MTPGSRLQQELRDFNAKQADLAGRGDLPPICIRCTTDHGLCTRHVPDVCPRLKQASWHRHAHSGMYHEANVRDRELSPAARRIQRRKERAAQRRRTRQVQRMARLIAGDHVPVARSA